jgi:hypothetical protein
MTTIYLSTITTDTRSVITTNSGNTNAASIGPGSNKATRYENSANCATIEYT